MEYALTVPRGIYDQINRYYKEAEPGKPLALLLTHIGVEGQSCRFDITDFVSLNEPITGNSAGFLQSPALMDAIDRAMESGMGILHLYSYPDAQAQSFDPVDNINNRILFRIAYHYLPSGPHACAAFNGASLIGKVWLRNLSTAPMTINIA